MGDLVYDMSYNDILKLPCELRESTLSIFEGMITNIPDEIYSNYKTLGNMILESELMSSKDVSTYAFPGDIVKYYPNIKVRKVMKSFTCSVSGEIITVGHEAIVWNPLFWLPGKNKTYVLSRNIRAYYYYEDFFPRDVVSFDEFMYKVNHSYELELDDYYNFYCNTGGISLKKLNRK